MAVLVFVGLAERKLSVFRDDDGRVHVIRAKTDVEPLADELHRCVVGNLVDGDGGILPDFPGDPVQEAFIEPFTGLRRADLGLRILIAVKRSGFDTGMEGGVVGADVFSEKGVKILQGVDRIHVKAVEPALLCGSPEPLDLCL